MCTRADVVALDNLLACKVAALKSMACAAQDLFVAHVGDSGAFVIREGKARRLTLDHKPTNPAERERIANAGGMVSS